MKINIPLLCVKRCKFKYVKLQISILYSMILWFPRMVSAIHQLQLQWKQPDAGPNTRSVLRADSGKVKRNEHLRYDTQNALIRRKRARLHSYRWRESIASLAVEWITVNNGRLFLQGEPPSFSPTYLQRADMVGVPFQAEFLSCDSPSESLRDKK